MNGFMAMYKFNKNTYHFTDAHGNQFQFNINFEDNHCRLWKREVGAKDWKEVKASIINEMEGKILNSTLPQKGHIEELLTALMMQINVERLNDDK